MLLALHTIYLRSTDNSRQAISLPSDIDVRQLLGSISALQSAYGTIRACHGNYVLFELDIEACRAFISGNYPPTSHPFRQFIDGLKFQRQGNWKDWIKNSNSSLANLCDTLFTWDDAALDVTYSSLISNDRQHKQLVFAAAQLYRIIGRQLEHQFYDHLKKALSRPNICHNVVLEVGRAIISLRRRLAPWAQRWNKSQPWDNIPFPPEIESHANEGNEDACNLRDGSVIPYRVRNICLILYVYFCYMRRRLSVEEQSDLHTMEVWDPENDRMVKEHLPQYESIKGFEDWLQFIIN